MAAKSSTITGIRDAYNAAGSWQALAAQTGINRASLCAVANHAPCSTEFENEIRQALGLPVPKRRRLIRPVASAEANERRERIGATWAQVIERGLRSLETERQAKNEQGNKA